MYQLDLAPPFQFADGGAREAGFEALARDCVVRSFAIATGKPYADVRNDVLRLAKLERPRNGKLRSTPRNGVHKPTIQKLAAEYGMRWTPTMSIGSGTTVHVRTGELPESGRHVLSLSKHVTALVDGVIFYTDDPSRDGTRAVYGYWSV